MICSTIYRDDKDMKIEITKQGSKAFYREVVNISAQYRYILKKHHRKLRDYFKQFRILLILGAVFFVILLLMAVFWGVDPFDYAALAILGTAVILCAAYLFMLNRMLTSMLTDPRASVLSLDDCGVELNKGGSQIVKLGWENIAVVCVYQESLTFVSGDRTGLVISVTRQYADEILAWLSANQPSVEVVESQK